MNAGHQIEIRRAKLREIIDLRWRILRAGLPRAAADFHGDDESTTHHFGAFLTESRENVGCATFVRRAWNDQPAWQLRGMGVREDLRGRGIGQQMLELAEQILSQQKHSQQLWCNARTPATHFYQRLGWQRVGEEFVVPTAGPHFKMTKLLTAAV